LGYSPEREDPGNKKFSTATIPKVVSSITEKCLSFVDALYKNIVIKTVPGKRPLRHIFLILSNFSSLILLKILTLKKVMSS